MTKKLSVVFAFLFVLASGVDFGWSAGERPAKRVDRLNQCWIPTDPDLRGSLYTKGKTTVRPEGLFDTDVMIPMRDGVKLAATIFKSPLGGPFPTILVRTPYGRGEVDELQLLILQGYAIVVQDLRGKGDSEGEDRVFQDDGWGELQDGYDTVEWIATQSWCNGKVATWGPSALGIVQGLMAVAKPPHLVCQVIGYAPCQGYGHAVYQNGVFRTALLDGWLTKHGSGHMLPTFQEHPTYDAFWEQYNIAAHHSEINLPALFIGGFYDCFEQGTLDDFNGRQNNGAEGARGNQRLIIGPWTHTNEIDEDREQGALIYPPNSLYSVVSELDDTLEWLNYWMKGENNDAMNGAAVTYYVMGDVDDENAPGNEWRESDIWPPESNEVHFNLHGDGTLSTAAPSGAQPTSALGCDPANPIKTLGGMNLEIHSGPYDQTSIEVDPNVLVFSTGPLAEPVEVIGRINAVIYAASNLTDNDITIRMTDVYPDGRSMLVCDGIARASFRDSYTDPTPITPGEVYRYEVDLWSTSIIFNAGHEIRIIIANTNDPRFEMNSLYTQLGQNGVPSSIETVIHHSPEHTSYLALPVIGEVVSVDDWYLH